MKGMFAVWLLTGSVVVAVLLSSCADRNTGEDMKGELSFIDPCVETAVPAERIERFDRLVERSAGVRLVKIPAANSVLIGTFTGEDRIDMERLESLRMLSESELDTLAQILFGYTGNMFRSRCYSPRHGILFVDANEKPLEFLEICLECNQLRSTHNLLGVSPLLCPDQTAALKKLFEA